MTRSPLFAFRLSFVQQLIYGRRAKTIIRRDLRLFGAWRSSALTLTPPNPAGQRREGRRMTTDLKDVGENVDHKGLRALLVIHGLITVAASIVLTVAPGLLPSVIGVHLEPSANVVVYLLAGAELGFAVLSFGGSRLKDPQALRLVVWSCGAFQGSTGALEIYAYAQGASVAILGNVAARAVIIALFAYLSKNSK
jgi:hypothetical protein